jgi:hypothetical protein
MRRLRLIVVLGMVIGVGFIAAQVWSAYHHAGEADAPKFLAAYPDKAGSKLDQCSTCHSGGSYVSGGKTTVLGSCQWCHYKYGYDKSGDITATLNTYGQAYKAAGRTAAALKSIENADSDSDGYSNLQEINALTYPGDAGDNPGLVPAPYRVFTRDQLLAMPQHKQFLLMNTTKSGDSYAEYSGVTLENLLIRAGMTGAATGINVYSPDGFSTSHPLDPSNNASLYHVRGTYPAAQYYYDLTADVAKSGFGWCDYNAPSNVGRANGDSIAVSGGLRNILAIKRDGVLLNSGVLNVSNKLDGEGPYRVVPPQKTPGPPDQASTAANQAVIWPYNVNADHNAGYSSRSVTIIKVNPLPAGTTDINVLEAGWSYIDQAKVVVYGAIATDNYATPVSATGTGQIAVDIIDASPGAKITQVNTYLETQINLNRAGIPSNYFFKDGVVSFKVTGIAVGSTVQVQLLFPSGIPAGSKIYKVDAVGYREITNPVIVGNAVTLTITDGGIGDADGIANGEIVDPVGVASPLIPADTGGGGGSGCFIATAAYGSYLDPHVQLLRDFRDKWLLTNSAGRAFVDWYYHNSPKVADVIGKSNSLRFITRSLLTPVVYTIKFPALFAALVISCMVLIAGKGTRKNRGGKKNRRKTRL